MADQNDAGERELLRRMERRFLEAILHLPDLLDPLEVDRIRYALGLASLHTFQPGAAVHGRHRHRPAVEIAAGDRHGFRARLFECLGPALIDEGTPTQVVRRSRRAIRRLERDLRSSRRHLLEQNIERFSAAELDAEVGCKALVVAAGGGGGAGYVHLGAFSLLEEVGLQPALIVGTSMGSVIGLFRARERRARIRHDLDWARGLEFERIFRFGSGRPHFGLPGLMQLHLVAALGELFRRPDGRLLRLPELHIPFLTVVAGIRRDMLRGTPDEWARRNGMVPQTRPGFLGRTLQFGRAITSLVPFLQPGVARRIVIGADDLTRHFVAIDAAGFSSAVPGILHYDVARQDEPMTDLLKALLQREGVAALADGGLVENVPVDTARHAVEQGHIGTRNAFVLGLDCFHPMWAPRQAWLWPLTRLVQVQTDAIAHHADLTVSYSEAPSPLDLLPDGDQLDRALETGSRDLEQEIGLVRLACSSFHWTD